MDVALWILWQVAEPLDVHPGWWFGVLVAAVMGLFGFLTKIWMEDRKDRRAERDEAKAERARDREEAKAERETNRKAIDDLGKFHREHMVGMIKENQVTMNHVADTLLDATQATNELTKEVRADRLERRSLREQQAEESGIHGPRPQRKRRTEDPDHG